jgi:hypothetical protein
VINITLLLTNITVCDTHNVTTHKLYGILHVCDNHNITTHKLHGILQICGNHNATTHKLYSKLFVCVTIKVYAHILQINRSIFPNCTVDYLNIVFKRFLPYNFTGYDWYILVIEVYIHKL